MDCKGFKKLLICFILIIFMSSGCTGPAEEEDAVLKAKVDEYVNALNALESNPRVSGTILIASEEKILLKKSYGMANYENKIPFENETRFRLASATKLITATAIMQLVEKGMLNLNDPVSKYISDFSRGDDINIQHLLTHTSGVTRDPAVGSKTYVTKDKLISSFKDKALDFEPGTAWSYSNCNYQALAYILEQVTKQNYEDYVRDNILQPSGMTNTGCDTGKGDVDKLAVGYTASNEKFIKAPPVNLSVVFGSGHIYSTVEDMYKLYNALNSGKLITKDSLNSMLQDNTGLESGYGYGLFTGKRFGHRWAGHGGNLSNGYSTNFVMFPDDNAVIIFLTNISFQDTDKLATDLAAILFDQEFIMPKETDPIELDAKVLKKYEGIYESTSGQKVEIKLIGKNLCVMPEFPETVLIPYSETEFYVDVHKSTKLKIKLNEKGAVTGMIVQDGANIQEASKVQ